MLCVRTESVLKEMNKEREGGGGKGRGGMRKLRREGEEGEGKGREETGANQEGRVWIQSPLRTRKKRSIQQQHL